MSLNPAAAAGLAFALISASQAVAKDDRPAAGQGGRSAILKCAGQRVFGPGAPNLAAGPSLTFAVSVVFGEGEILALADPETSKVDKVIYDAESTTGSLRFGDGGETTIVWTRMAGAAGPLVGEAVTSDGDVIALSIERAPSGSAERPFVLFGAAGASAYRGACSPDAQPVVITPGAKK